MSKTIYDLNQFSRYVPEDNKPYYIIDPQSEEEQRRLFDYVGQVAHFEGFSHELKRELELRPEGAIIRIADALPIGETVKGEIVLLIIQGLARQNKLEGGSFVVVCAPTGLDQLYSDLEVNERKVKATIKKLVRNAIERN